MKKVLVSWSGGKDGAMALYEIVRAEQSSIAGLLTTVTRDYDRVSIHGTRRALLAAQAESLGLPLHEVFIPKDSTNEEYEQAMSAALLRFRDESRIETIVFGDLFLEDIKAYRDRLLARLKMRAEYPVWRRDTTRFIKDFIELGFKAVVVSVNAARLDASFAGKRIDEDFLATLPADVDPCGENGEFHSFVFAGPVFQHEVKFQIGETVLRDGYYYCDLLFI